LTKQLYFNEGLNEFDYSGVATQSPSSPRSVNNTLEEPCWVQDPGLALWYAQWHKGGLTT